MLQTTKYMLLFSMTVLFTLMAHAAKTQSSVQIKAKTANFNIKNHIVKFKGNVKTLQGSTKILSDSLILILNKDNNIEHAKALGNPSKVYGKDKNGEPFYARANVIIYYPNTKHLKLSGNALLKRHKNTLHAEHIDYYTDKEILKTSAKRNKAVVLRYQFKSKKAS